MSINCVAEFTLDIFDVKGSIRAYKLRLLRSVTYTLIEEGGEKDGSSKEGNSINREYNR